LEVDLSLGGLLWYNVVDKAKKCNHVLFDSMLSQKKSLFLSLLKKMRKMNKLVKKKGKDDVKQAS